jgi:SAM-dependent MidA family methyltransferase
VDYAVDPRRDVAGTLTGYRNGRQVLPVPDGSSDITAHVLMQSCAAAVGDVSTALVVQQTALRALGVQARRPAYGADPHAYLSALQKVGEATELLDPDGLGAFSWLLQAKSAPLPL